MASVAFIRFPPPNFSFFPRVFTASGPNNFEVILFRHRALQELHISIWPASFDPKNEQ